MLNDLVGRAQSTALTYGWRSQDGDEGDVERIVVRDQTEIVDRLLVMHACAAAACGYPRDRADAWIRREGLAHALVDWESQFLEKGYGRIDHFQNSVEAIWAMAWVVGVVPELHPLSRCPDNLARILPNLLVDETSEGFRMKAKEPATENAIEGLILMRILDNRIYGHGAQGGRIPRKVDLFVLLARKKALEWVCSNQEWDAMVWWRSGG